ncbi:MAG: four helix bundle protein [Planctomycetes bacterium]|nr:four helix bundle protein [Planctomycetota bacterium]
MSSQLSARPAAREAGPELLVLQRWEEFAGWLLDHTARWPKSARFSLVRRVDDHALDVTELLITARWEPGERRSALRAVNLRLERLRMLLRIALARGVTSAEGFESAMRAIDETGRMVHGWREALGGRGAEA